MSYWLFLDDYRIPFDGFAILRKEEFKKNDDWVVVRSHNEFVKTITEKGLPELVSFDHDLADAHYHESMYKDGKAYMKYVETTSEKTGYHSAKWLVEYCMDNNCVLPKFYVHSMNPVGRANIQELLDNFKHFQESNAEEKSDN